MRLPFVIDNSEERKMAHVLRELLALHQGKAMDVASAFFSINGYALIAPGLKGLGSFRLLLGSEPRGGADLGLRVRDAASTIRLQQVQGDLMGMDADTLRRELENSPLDSNTQLLVEDLIRFLREERVEVRRFTKGFLHAKSWIFYADHTKSGQGILLDRFQPLLGIVGSSNFTGPGLTSNNELNLTHQVILEEDQAQDAEAAGMVSYLGEEKASARITPKNRQLIKSEVGARAIQQLVEWYDGVWEQSEDYKEQFIEVLDASKYGTVEYTPYQIYLKALWHYFREDLGTTETPDRATAVELSEFQEDAVTRARRILARYHGVLIADSVGLGKTWIGKRLLEDYGYHQRQLVLVVAPASLKAMWDKELKQATISGTVITQESMGRDDFDPFAFGGIDVILIDESHKFQSQASQRYEALEQIIMLNGGRGRAGEHKKVILLTATPINNSLNDLYSQISLITQGDDGYFASAGIGDLKRYFLDARRAQRNAEGPGGNLFNILEEIAVRRPRIIIREHYPNATIDGKPIKWPERELHRIEYSLAKTYGNDFYSRIVERVDKLKLAPFDLESYRRDPSQAKAMDVGRGQALIGIFKSLYLKRFESSVEAFRLSIDRARQFQTAYRDHLREGRVLTARDFRKLAALNAEQDDDTNDPRVAEILAGMEQVSPEDYRVGDIEKAVEADLQVLSEIYGKVADIGPNHDAKYQQLRDLLRGQLKGQKLLLFTYYKDTSRYLYRCLREDKEFLEELGHPTIRIADSEVTPKDRERVVEAFAPRVNEKPNIIGTEREIDILISTDVLAEGKNLQDCQYLLNYDLHWAPMRLVQRAGRIDRIGTPFDVLHILNFFPESDLNKLLKLVETLQSKIEAIDAQGLHDASVLGETPHPRAFNHIERIHDGDTAVLDEEEREAELVSSEEMRLELQKALEDGAEEVVKRLPDGIHSIRELPKARGVFFCFDRDGMTVEDRRAIWLYWDAHSQRFEDNIYRMIQLVSCKPDEPRGHSVQSVYELIPKAIEHIVQGARRTAATEQAPPRLPAEQTSVRVALQENAARVGVPRSLLLRLIRFLGAPTTGFAERQFKQYLARYQQSRDAKKLAEEVDDLRVKFEGEEQVQKAERSQPITAEELRLVCFEYIS